MKYLSKIVFTPLLSLASLAFADEERTPSIEYRNNAQVSLLAIPIGFYPYPGGGVRAGFIFNGNFVGEIGYASAKSNWSGISKYIHSMVDASLRWFPSNAFSLVLGIEQRRIRINYGVGDFFEETFSETYTTNTSTGFRFAIANQWQFGKFVLGVDWAGFYVPIYGIQGDIDHDGDELDEEDRQKIKSHSKRRNEEGSPRFLQLTLGVAF